jgi:hypothetical protein
MVLGIGQTLSGIVYKYVYKRTAKKFNVSKRVLITDNPAFEKNTIAQHQL